MSSAAYPSSRSHGQSSAFHGGPQGSTTTTHPGTFAPGTKVQVGGQRVIVDRYLSEGGFAHVYVVRVPQLRSDGTKSSGEVAVLKRVAVPDKENLANMRTEVETMKKLKGHRHIVTYMDSHASQLKEGGFEVFLLMEFCSGGGLIDFMNTRLQHRLTEPEILHIFADVSEGVAAMHYLEPPLLHRDLKVENVLISSSGGNKIYKLCDFGSAARPRPAASTAAEGRLIEEDIMKHTTMQYRSPEMVDVYRKHPIDEKSDIWALGVLLYKLCYYTTPFEEKGQMAILNASFKYPQYPAFSDRLKRFIGSMLRENPQQRPNIYQVVCEVCSMRGKQVPIKDIYSNRTESQTRRNQKLPSESSSPQPVVGLSKVSPEQSKPTAMPEIAPMRRGRPKHTHAEPVSVSTSSPKDPWAALDSKDYQTRVAAVDELSTKFPSLDEFSLLHDQGTNYQFNSESAPVAKKSPENNLQKKVTEALADEVFAKPQLTKSAPAVVATSPSKPDQRMLPPRSHPEPKTVSSMISTGVQTSPAPTPSPQPFDISQRSIWRVPSKSPHDLSSRAQPSPEIAQSELPPRPEPSGRRHFFERNKTKSQAGLNAPKATSSRPSLESQRPSLDFLEVDDKARSSSAHRYSPKPDSPPFMRPSSSHGNARPGSSDQNITSNVDFLRSMESSDDNNTKKVGRRRSSSGAKAKRASIPSISLANTKSVIAGKFGDAFRRFEQDRPGNSEAEPINMPLSPITAFSDNQDTDDEGFRSTAQASNVLSEDEASLSPEVRRELERQRLAQEERRVAAAQAEYRAGFGGAIPRKPVTKASSIQNRVKNLLESNDTGSSNAPKTAEGYGRYTNSAATSPVVASPKNPIISKKPLPVPSPNKPNFDKPLPPVKIIQNSQVAQRTGPKVAPKPTALRTGTPPVVSPTKPSMLGAKPDNQSQSEDWEADFSKRFPSLSGIEMVEREIEARGPVRDV